MKRVLEHYPRPYFCSSAKAIGRIATAHLSVLAQNLLVPALGRLRSVMTGRPLNQNIKHDPTYLSDTLEYALAQGFFTGTALTHP